MIKIQNKTFNISIIENKKFFYQGLKKPKTYLIILILVIIVTVIK